MFIFLLSSFSFFPPSLPRPSFPPSCYATDLLQGMAKRRDEKRREETRRDEKRRAEPSRAEPSHGASRLSTKQKQTGAPTKANDYNHSSNISQRQATKLKCEYMECVYAHCLLCCQIELWRVGAGQTEPVLFVFSSFAVASGRKRRAGHKSKSSSSSNCKSRIESALICRGSSSLLHSLLQTWRGCLSSTGGSCFRWLRLSIYLSIDRS